MWCIVNLPNGTQQAVKWDPKAIGQECLEKVCKALGIICEMEYFGLEHWTPQQKESRTHQWINLRNRLSGDSGSGSGIQLMLALRVKFWVPVHFILQESARNLFYMQAKVDLLEGRLKPLNWSSAAKLSALLCQADGLRFQETAIKSECPLKIKREHDLMRQQQYLANQQQQQQANKDRKDKEHVLSFKKRRLSKQKSVENIDHVQCSNTSAGCSNNVAASCSSIASNLVMVSAMKPNTSSTNEPQSTKVPSPPLSAASTSSCFSVELKSVCDNSNQAQLDESIEMIIRNSPLRIYQDYVVRPENVCEDEELPEDFLRQIAKEHGKLDVLKMSPKSAKYWLLQEIQELPGFGEEVFSGVTSSNEQSQRCEIAVGAHGIKVTTGDNEKNIPFSAIAAAKSFRRTFKLEYVDDHNERRELDMKLPRHCIAAGLYRAITERHAFYVCDKVRGVVTNQFTRDLKGTIASMFKEDTELGKRYVFDIQHTSREVHDQARRILHERGIVTTTTNVNDANSELEEITRRGSSGSDMASLDMVLKEKQEREAAIERCVDTRISEAMTCKICMDQAINTMFNPCCHVMACDQCAARCDKCPNCRVKITNVVKIFLPPELRTSMTNNTGCAQKNANTNNNNNNNNTLNNTKLAVAV